MIMLKDSRINPVALLLAVVALCGAYKTSRYGVDHTSLDWLLYMAIVVSLFATFSNYRRLLKITEAPISTIAAAAQGYIELQGVALTALPFTTPHLQIPCVWYRAWTYAHYRDDPLSSQPTDARLLDCVVSDQAFQLKDKSGICIIAPQGAEVRGALKREAIKNNHRYVEEYLPTGKQLYVIGHLDTRDSYYTTEAVNHDVGEVLKTWKQTPDKLVKRFDQDLNGKIDLQEWEQVRTEAKREVSTRHRARNHMVYTLAEPSNKQIFLISSLSPQALRNQYQVWSVVHFITMIVCMTIVVS